MTFKIEIDDLEEIEANEIRDFLNEAVDNDDLGFNIKDCITIYKLDDTKENHWIEQR